MTDRATTSQANDGRRSTVHSPCTARARCTGLSTTRPVRQCSPRQDSQVSWPGTPRAGAARPASTAPPVDLARLAPASLNRACAECGTASTRRVTRGRRPAPPARARLRRPAFNAHARNAGQRCIGHGKDTFCSVVANYSSGKHCAAVMPR